MGKLFLIFVIMPIIEIAVLIHVGDIIGGWNTVLLVILSAMMGAYLVKREGVLTLAQAQQKMQQGEVPAAEIGSGILLLIAGVLLVTPGFITDIFGLMLTLPLTRNKIGATLFSALNVNMQAGGAQFHYQQTSDDIIDGEFRETHTAPDKQISTDTPESDKSER